MANNVVVSFRVVDRASNSFRRIARSTQELERSNKNAENQFANMAQVTLAVTGTIVASLGRATAAFAEVENAVARLNTVTRGSAPQIATALDNARASAVEFSEQFTASASEIIDAQFQIATAGVAVEEQIAATQGAFKLAVATQGTFAQSTQLLGSLLNTFGKAAEFGYLEPGAKVQALTDKLSLAVQRFQVTLPVLAESLKFVIGPASTLGLKFGEVTSALGVLNTAGFRGSLAGTALSNMFNKLDRAVDMLNLDPSQFTDLNGNLKDMSSFLEEVQKGIKGMSSIEQQNKLIEVFDIRAGRVVKTLLNQVKAIRKNTLAMELNQGATQQMADLQQNTLSAASAKAGNAFNNLAVAIGESLAPVAKIAVKVIHAFASALRTLVEGSGVVGTVILSVIAVLSTFVVAIVAGTVAARAFATLGIASAIRSVIKYVAAINFAKFAQLGLIGSMRASMIATHLATVGFVTAATGATGFAASITAVIIELTIATAGIFLLVVAVGKLLSMFIDTGDGAEKMGEDISKSMKGVSQSTATAASELERIAKLSKSDIGLLPGEDLGTSPLAEMLEKVADSQADTSVKNLVGELKKLAAQEGTTVAVAAVTQQLGDQFKGGADAARQFASDSEQLRNSLDLSFQKLSDIEKAASIAKTAVSALGTQMLINAGGNEELAASFTKVNNAIQTGQFDKLAELFQDTNFIVQASRNTSARDFARRIKKVVDNEQVRAAISEGGDNLAELLEKKLKDGFEKIDPSIAGSVSASETFTGGLAQIDTALSNVNKNFKNAEKGVLTYTEATKRVQQAVATAQQQLQQFEGVDLSRFASDFKVANPLDGRTLEEITKDFEDAIAKAQLDALDAKLQIENNKFIADLEKKLGGIDGSPIGKKLIAQAREMGKGLKDAMSKFLQGGSPKDLGEALKTQIRDKVLEGLSERLSTQLLASFAPGISELERQLTNVANQGLSPDLSAVQRQVLDIIADSDIGQKLGLNEAANEFVEKLQQGLDKANVKLEVLLARNDVDNVTRVFAEQLQSLTTRALQRGGEGLRDSIAETSALLGQATARGADNSIVRLIENQLEKLLETQQGLERSNDDSQQFVQGLSSATQQLSATLSSQGDQFVSGLKDGAEAIRNSLSQTQSLTDRVADAAGAQIDVSIGGVTTNVNVTIDGGGGVAVDQDDLEQTKQEVLEQVDQQLDQAIRDVLERIESGR